MKTQTVSYVKAHFAEVIDGVRAGAEPVLVTQNGTGTVVIQSHEDYERIRKALLLLKLVALGEREIQQSGGVPHDELFAALRARRAKRKPRR